MRQRTRCSLHSLQSKGWELSWTPRSASPTGPINRSIICILYTAFCIIVIHLFSTFSQPSFPGISHSSQLKRCLSGLPTFTPSLPLIHSPHCSRYVSGEYQSGPVTLLYEAFVTPQRSKILHATIRTRAKRAHVTWRLLPPSPSNHCSPPCCLNSLSISDTPSFPLPQRIHMPFFIPGHLFLSHNLSLHHTPNPLPKFLLFL